jgi:hypothetical protein
MVTVAFSSDGGETWDIAPSESLLSGDAGTGVGNGANRRIVWIASGSLPSLAMTRW